MREFIKKNIYERKKIDLRSGLGGIFISFTIILLQLTLFISFSTLINVIGTSFKTKVMCDAIAVSAAHGSYDRWGESYDVSKARNVAYKVYDYNNLSSSLYPSLQINVVQETKELTVKLTTRLNNQNYTTTTVMKGLERKSNAPEREDVAYPTDTSIPCTPYYKLEYRPTVTPPANSFLMYTNVVSQFNVVKYDRYNALFSSKQNAVQTLFNDTKEALHLTSQFNGYVSYQDVGVGGVARDGCVYILFDGSDQYFVFYNNGVPSVSYITTFGENSIRSIYDIPGATCKKLLNVESLPVFGYKP